MHKDLQYIYDVQKELTSLNGIAALLGWDEKTYMPKKGVSARAEQTGIIQTLIYDKLTDKRLFSTLDFFNTCGSALISRHAARDQALNISPDRTGFCCCQVLSHWRKKNSKQPPRSWTRPSP